MWHPPPFKSSDIDFIECKPEFSIGSGKRVDLVIEITLNNGDLKYIVIEMKVDTIAKKTNLLQPTMVFTAAKMLYLFFSCLDLLKFVRFQNISTLILFA